MTGRYIGGQYDSVKQSAYIDYIFLNKKQMGKIPAQAIYDDYTARLRLDILLSGHVILTDAMFFDGQYFQTIFLDEEKRKDFSNFLNMQQIGGFPPLIEIRHRGTTVDNTLLNMIYKKSNPIGFVFSSLSRDYYKNSISSALAITQNQQNEYSSWKEFLSDAISVLDDEPSKQELRRKIAILEYMVSIPEYVLRTWDRKYDFQSVLADAKNNGKFSELGSGDPLIDEVIRSIDIQCTKEYPDRSELQKQISTKTDIFKRPPITDDERNLELKWGQFQRIYNRALGIQHGCDTFDIGELFASDENNNSLEIGEISQSTLQSLAKESWSDFARKYNELNFMRNKWFEDAWDYENNKTSSPYKAQKSLESYVSHILKVYQTRPTFTDFVNLIGGGSSIDIDVMSPHNIAFGVSSTVLKVAIQTFDLAKREWRYFRDKSNVIELGKKFSRSIH